jgi:hypothetical protein
MDEKRENEKSDYSPVEQSSTRSKAESTLHGLGLFGSIAAIAGRPGRLTQDRLRLAVFAVFAILCLGVAASAFFTESGYKAAILSLCVVLAFVIVLLILPKPSKKDDTVSRRGRRWFVVSLALLGLVLTVTSLSLASGLLYKVLPWLFLRQTAVEDASRYFARLREVIQAPAGPMQADTLRRYTETITPGFMIRVFGKDYPRLTKALNGENQSHDNEELIELAAGFREKYFGVETLSVEMIDPPSWRPVQVADDEYEQILLAIVAYQGSFLKNDLLREVPRPTIEWGGREFPMLLQGKGTLAASLASNFVNPLTDEDIKKISGIPCEKVFREEFVDAVAVSIGRTKRAIDIQDNKYDKGREIVFLSIRLKRDKGFFSHWRVDEVAVWGLRRQFINPLK